MWSGSQKWIGQMWRAHRPPDRSYLIPPPIASTQDAVYAYGGVDLSGSTAPHTELWRLDLAVGGWRSVPTVGSVPEASFGHSLVALRDHLLVFGARKSQPTLTSDASVLQPAPEESPPTADLFALNLRPPPALAASAAATAASDNASALALRWERLPAALPARIDHCAVAHEGSALMFIAGGAGPSGLLDDLWQLEYLAAWHTQAGGDDGGGGAAAPGWSLLHGGAIGGLRPPARRGHTCALRAHRMQLLLAGGRGADGAPLRDDLWSFDLSQRVWRQIAPARAPSSFGVHAPLAMCGGRAVLMDGNQSSTEVAVFSDAHQRWERAGSGGFGGSGAGAARLAPPPYPGALQWAHATSPADCSASSRLWLLGVPATSAPSPPPAELWQLTLGLECASGCVHGVCDGATGRCECEEGWGGAACSRPVCGVPCGENGVCDKETRTCQCKVPWYGARCEHRTCADECVAPHGACNNRTGACTCTPPWYGVACEYAACPVCQNGARCGHTTGCCECAPGFTGCDCSIHTTGRWHALQPPPMTRRYDAACALCGGVPLLFGGVVTDPEDAASTFLPALAHEPSRAARWTFVEGGGGVVKPLAPPVSSLSSELWAVHGAAEPRGLRWERVIASDDQYVGAPAARRSAAAAGLGQSLLVLHGGLVADGSANGELWVLLCKPVAPGAPRASWRLARTDTSLATPAPRAYHTLVKVSAPSASPGAVSAILFGGCSPSSAASFSTATTAEAAVAGEPTGRFYGDVWLLTIATDADAAAALGVVQAEWKRVRINNLAPRGVDPASLRPAPRAGHASVVHRHGPCCEASGCMLIFGGLNEAHQPLSDMWQLCFANRTWSEIKPRVAAAGEDDTEPWPAARHQHTLTGLPAMGLDEGAAAPDVLLLFGGVRSDSSSPLHQDGLWLFDLRTLRWLRVHVPPGSAQPSSQLAHHAVAAGQNALWLYEGLSQLSPALPPSSHAASTTTSSSSSWQFLLPDSLDDDLIACDGCSAHGACDLSLRRCICDPPWSGSRCDAMQRAAVPTAPRRMISMTFWLSASLLVGGVLGWINKQRALKREEEYRERRLARERARLNPQK